MQEKLNLVIELQKLIVKINNFVQHIDEPEYLVDLVSGDLLKQYRRERIEEAARAWRNLTDEAKLLGLRFHDLRHHCITKLAEAGVPDQTLMSISGHLNRQMLEHYPYKDASEAGRGSRAGSSACPGGVCASRTGEGDATIVNGSMWILFYVDIHVDIDAARLFRPLASF